MTAAEKHWRDAAAKADAWAGKAEAAGRLEDAATLTALAAAAKAKADEAARLPPALAGSAEPDPSTACAICGAPGVRCHGGLTLACTNHLCPRYGTAVAATVF